MRKRTKIIVLTLCIVTAIVAALCVWQRNNIAAFIKFATQSESKITQDLDNRKKLFQTELKKYSDNIIIRDFTAEEQKQILSGKISAEDAIKLITGDDNKDDNSLQNTNQNDDKNTHNSNNGTNNENVQKAPTKTVDTILNENLVKLYSAKAYFLGQLGGMESSAKADYAAGMGKSSLISKYFGMAKSLESQCDGQVSSILATMRSDLEAIGADTSIISTIQSAYYSEKESMKAYYFSKF